MENRNYILLTILMHCVLFAQTQTIELVRIGDSLGYDIPDTLFIFNPDNNGFFEMTLIPGTALKRQRVFQKRDKKVSELHFTFKDPDYKNLDFLDKDTIIKPLWFIDKDTSYSILLENELHELIVMVSVSQIRSNLYVSISTTFDVHNQVMNIEYYFYDHHLNIKKYCIFDSHRGNWYRFEAK